MRLNIYNPEMEETACDGNYFFRVVPRMVYVLDEFYLNVRSQAVVYFGNQREEFEDFITTVFTSIDNHITLMSRNGHWVDNAIIRATSEALNIEIHIESSAEDTPTITFRPTTNNPSQTIFLSHITHLHYVSTRSLSEPQIMSYGGCKKDGVRLIKTQVLDNVLTWLYFLMTKYKTFLQFMTSIEHVRNVKPVVDTYRIFKRGNAADSKRNWFEFASGKRPHVYDEFISFQDIKDTDVVLKLTDTTPLGEVR